MSDLALDAEEEVRDPTSEYWWRIGDDEEGDNSGLASELQSRIDAFEDVVRSARFFRWCRKSWDFYYSQVYNAGSGWDDMGNVPLGDQGELVGAQINHHRNLIRHLFNLVAKDRLNYKCRARNSDLRSRWQADLGNGLIEYYLHQEHAEAYTTAAKEHALVLAEGFVCLTWDTSKGEEIDADPTTMTTISTGDLAFHNPLSWNVIRDLGVREWSRHKWIGVRSPANKWELLAQFPDHQEAIMSADDWRDTPQDEDQIDDQVQELSQTDQIEKYEFWHERSKAMPKGRYVLMVGGEILLDADMPYRDKPVHRVVVSELIGSPWGYTPAFDLIGIQELINMVVSTIATICHAFGVPTIWKKKGDTLIPSQIEGLTLLTSEEKPEILQFTNVPAVLFEFLDRLVRHAEIIAGVDQITRGAPDEHIRSGAYAALLQAQSVQFASSFVRSSTQLEEAVGTAMLRILRDFATEERVVTIIGKHNRQYRKHFTGDDLDLIDRVTVEVTNPILTTTAGKIEYAQMLLGATGSNGKPLISTPEEVLNVFQTGQVESLLEAETAQLSAIREENELLLDGLEVPPPMPEDNHILHIKEHYSIFGTKETRGDPQLRSAAEAHVMEHLTLLMEDSNTQILQTMLGYDTPFPPGSQPAGSEGGPPSGEPMNPEELVAAPEGMNPDLDGRSVVQMPEPALPAGM